MKGLRGRRTAPSNHRKNASGHGSTTFRPALDLKARQHREFDAIMNDAAHKKRMAKVTLPKITMPMMDDDEGENR